METKYSLKKGILNDKAMFAFIFVFIGITIILIVFIRFNIIIYYGRGGTLKDNGNFNVDDRIFFITSFILCNIILVILSIFRINRLKYLFNYGLENDAEIFDKICISGIYYFVYIYKINNIEYKFKREIEQMEISLKYKKGDIVKVLVDPRNYEKSILKDDFIVKWEQ
jgi:hypothetical protein